MDILAIIRPQIEDLPEGEYVSGLNAVLRHIDVATKHLQRGKSDGNSDLYTDAVYRTNQAFEGSIKEAYRVLAASEPKNKNIFEIEKYLAKNNIFKDRILKQFTAYRTEWRNPSTHDYTLQFDDSEAFLAIVSVSAFTKLLMDQIVERLAFDQINQNPPSPSTSTSPSMAIPFVEQVSAAVLDFATNYAPAYPSLALKMELQISSALHAFLSTVLLSTNIFQDEPLPEDRRYRPDLQLIRAEENIIIEVKRANNTNTIASGVSQVLNYLEVNQNSNAILFVYAGIEERYELEKRGVREKTVWIIKPI